MTKALITSAGDSSTRWVSVHQPDLIPGRRGQLVKEDELNVVDHVVSHVQLSRALVPGVAMISVQGLRASLPPTQHYLRFSSLKTLPIQVRISGGSFSTSLAWSALPGSIISVPPGRSRMCHHVAILYRECLGTSHESQRPAGLSVWLSLRRGGGLQYR